MIRKKVIYGHSVPYRNMCRYNSGVSPAVSRGSCFKREKAENVSVGVVLLQASSFGGL
jgi:hypothetical protein